MENVISWPNRMGPCGLKIGGSFQTPITPNNCWGGPFQVDNICGGIYLYANVKVLDEHNGGNQRVKITCHSGVWRSSLFLILNSDGAASVEFLFQPDIAGYGILPGTYQLHFELEDKNNNARMSASGIIRLRPGIFHDHRFSA